MKIQVKSKCFADKTIEIYAKKVSDSLKVGTVGFTIGRSCSGTSLDRASTYSGSEIYRRLNEVLQIH